LLEGSTGRLPTCRGLGHEREPVRGLGWKENSLRIFSKNKEDGDVWTETECYEKIEGNRKRKRLSLESPSKKVSEREEVNYCGRC